MKVERRIFTSESVTEGHPDKICDHIADAILDDLLTQDPDSRVACEVAVATGLVVVLGEITTKGYADIPKIVRRVVNDIGYNRGKYGFDAENLAVMVSVNEQSSDISMGVDTGGAGDQGMMFGFACDETAELMPLPIVLAHKLAKKLSEVRHSEVVDFLRPDGKTQVGVEYDENGLVKRIDSIVVSTQHDEQVSQEVLRKTIIDLIINPVVPKELIDNGTKIYVNPTGRFVIGGPKGDSGVTGRKIIVDTYGGYARHGGGAFSGKDPTKVDRSAAYMTRYIAKNIVAAGLAHQIEIQIAYAIGMSQPTSLCVNTFGTSLLSDSEIIEIIRKHFDLSPRAIIQKLKLKQPIYEKISVYGHFGTNQDVPWEQIDMVDTLKIYSK